MEERHDEDYFVKRKLPEADEKKKPDSVTSDAPSRKSSQKIKVRKRKLFEDINEAEKRRKTNLPQENKSRTPMKKGEGAGNAKALEKKGIIKDFFTFSDEYKAGNVDMPFLIILLMLLAFGVVMTFSASYAYAAKAFGDSYYFVEKQIIFAVFGLFTIVAVTLFPIKTYKVITYVLLAAVIILLIAVLLVGSSGGGAQRWLNIPGLGRFQPSELAKTIIVMYLAMFMTEHSKEIESKTLKKSFLYGVLLPGLFILLIGGLVVLEKHFSGLIIICSIGAAMMYMGGAKLRFIIPIALAAIAIIITAILTIGYSSNRIEIWLDPWKDPGGAGWQTIQGLYAIASGGIFGVGLGNSRQKYGYVSQPQNDFIFTIVCEELGFIGAFALITLFLLLIWRGFVIARNSPNRYTYLVVAGFMAKILLQVAFNIAVVTNIFPNTGISLPFFSSGGTSLVVQMAEMGVVLSISRYSKQKR